MENVEEAGVNGDLKNGEDAAKKDSRSKCGKYRNGKESVSKKQSKAKPEDENKSLEELKRSLNSVTSAEEKITLLCEKYADLLEDNRKLALALKQSEKRALVLQAEKEQAQNESSKVILTKGRLENLCRELQRQNKTIKEESLARIREEEEKRKELSTRFNVTLNEINSLMQTNAEKNNQLREENKALTDKFKIICEQYEMRELQVEKLMKQNQLETKLSETKLAKVQVELMQEKELLLRELSNYQQQLKQTAENEDVLRGQIRMYSDKYEEFQQALAKSNEVFVNFKAEMDKMSKKIIKLEKETSSWKLRWEKSHNALIDMIADKQQRDEELVLAGKQVSQLQRLCRTLQEERSKHISKLREYDEDAGKSQPAIMKKEEIDALLERQPKAPMPLPVIDPVPIIDDDGEINFDPPAENSSNETAAAIDTVTVDSEQTEKKNSIDEVTVSTNGSASASTLNDPVPEAVVDKPAPEKTNKQSTPTPEKKKAKEGGRKKKK